MGNQLLQPINLSKKAVVSWHNVKRYFNTLCFNPRCLPGILLFNQSTYSFIFNICYFFIVCNRIWKVGKQNPFIEFRSSHFLNILFCYIFNTTTAELAISILFLCFTITISDWCWFWESQALMLICSSSFNERCLNCLSWAKKKKMTSHV